MRKETEGAQSRSEGESGPLSLLSPPPPPPVQTSVNPLLGMWGYGGCYARQRMLRCSWSWTGRRLRPVLRARCYDLSPLPAFLLLRVTHRHHPQSPPRHCLSILYSNTTTASPSKSLPLMLDINVTLAEISIFWSSFWRIFRATYVPYMRNWNMRSINFEWLTT